MWPLPTTGARPPRALRESDERWPRALAIALRFAQERVAALSADAEREEALALAETIAHLASGGAAASPLGEGAASLDEIDPHRAARALCGGPVGLVALRRAVEATRAARALRLRCGFTSGALERNLRFSVRETTLSL